MHLRAGTAGRVGVGIKQCTDCHARLFDLCHVSKQHSLQSLFTERADAARVILRGRAENFHGFYFLQSTCRAELRVIKSCGGELA